MCRYCSVECKHLNTQSLVQVRKKHEGFFGAGSCVGLSATMRVSSGLHWWWMRRGTHLHSTLGLACVISLTQKTQST